MWPFKRSTASALVNDRLEERVEDLERYNRRLIELANALAENLKEFSNDE
jgi:ferric-dicitrate binding protein FerR (iron transport regulator)